ncbi:hypothetical protein B0H14DRAFT_2618147 [Mycena olivaceomarginata]|nr:hypothetical protein B0H14DRAFT_2618147 [Mycena olivaceomarginata]
MAHIIPLIFNHSRSRPRKRDTDQHSAAFSPSRPLSEIRYARPCPICLGNTASWVIESISVGKLARKNRTDAQVIEWEDVAFSIEGLSSYTGRGRFLWYLQCFAASRKGGKVVKKTRPHPVIQVGAISSFITSRNRYASGNLTATWIVAFRLSSSRRREASLCRFGYSVSESTARNALNTLTNTSFDWDTWTTSRIFISFELSPISPLILSSLLPKFRLDSVPPLQSIGSSHERRVSSLLVQRRAADGKQGVSGWLSDFDKQMGIEPEKSDNLLSWNRGDGGTMEP